MVKYDMTREERENKSRRIREKGEDTRLRHASMRPLTVELKLDLKCLNNAERNKLFLFFAECRWLCNHLLGLSNDMLRDFDTRTRSITSLDKDGNPVQRELTMPAKFIQTVYSSLKQDMASLAAKRRKTGKRNGKLKFRSSYGSIELNQYGNTHWICYGPDGNKNGKYRNTIHIAGIKRPIRVFGMEQIPAGAEYANARLVKKPSGIYLMLTCYIQKHEVKENADEKPDLGIDFGIKAAITTSEGDAFVITVREPERLKGLQRKLARQKKGSRGWHDTKRRIQREYERLSNRRKAIANQAYHDIVTGRKLIVMQDENIKGWHKGLFGKEVQSSALGTLRRKLMSDPNVLVIDRFFPSTRMCPICGHIHNNITLSDRTFACPACGYTEDRDVKSAKTLLLAGKHEIACRCPGQTPTPVERMSGFDASYEAWKRSARKPEAPSSSVS